MTERQIISGIKADAFTKAAVLVILDDALDKTTTSPLIKKIGREAMQDALTNYIPAGRIATVDDLKQTAFNAFLISMNGIEQQTVQRAAIIEKFRKLLLGNK